MSVKKCEIDGGFIARCPKCRSHLGHYLTEGWAQTVADEHEEACTANLART